MRFDEAVNDADGEKGCQSVESQYVGRNDEIEAAALESSPR
jgi:hypothetical protein